jgi:hypothetical protein
MLRLDLVDSQGEEDASRSYGHAAAGEANWLYEQADQPQGNVHT